MTKKKILICALIAAVIVIGVASAIWFTRGGGGSEDEAIYMQKVSDLTGADGAAVSADRFSGVVEAQKSIDYKKEGDKKIEAVYVNEGDSVSKDTPLFKYDVSEAETQMASIGLDIEGLGNEIALLKDAEDTTENRLAIQQKQVEIQQKQAEQARYQQEIAQSTVKSTIEGTVKEVNADGGTDSSSGQEKPVVSITETGEFRVKGKIGEQSMGMLSAGQKVIIRSRVDSTKTWTGTISKVETEPVKDSSSSMDTYGDSSGERATRYPFYVSLDKTDGLLLGQHVFVEPDYGQATPEGKPGLWLDSSFIAYEEDGTAFVWSSDHGKLEKKAVELGEIDDASFTVEIRKGLTQEDWIAWPDPTYKEGMKTVEPTEEG